MRNRRRPSVPMPPDNELGRPSYEHMQRAAYQLQYKDECSEWEAELIDEYGFDRAIRAVRQHVTQAKVKAALEAERLRNEELRWRCGGVLPSGY